ncbi:hypothetical protein RclHR1_02270015 [Rhizophagus clarus]|uniref:Uncharacterized protein n=1 Tax=Rhizophagus clarus TaxID=94130 RepID=A0A2Z6RAK6_9GLOM|nr:hypothetical protein RclHR1_02270015 [Rhizophagus clarus]
MIIERIHIECKVLGLFNALNVNKLARIIILAYDPRRNKILELWDSGTKLYNLLILSAQGPCMRRKLSYLNAILSESFASNNVSITITIYFLILC